MKDTLRTLVYCAAMFVAGCLVTRLYDNTQFKPCPTTPFTCFCDLCDCCPGCGCVCACQESK